MPCPPNESVLCREILQSRKTLKLSSLLKEGYLCFLLIFFQTSSGAARSYFLSALPPPWCFLQHSSQYWVASLSQGRAVLMGLHRDQPFPPLLPSLPCAQLWLPLSTLHCLPCLCSIWLVTVDLHSSVAREKERLVKSGPLHHIHWDLVV